MTKLLLVLLLIALPCAGQDMKDEAHEVAKDFAKEWHAPHWMEEWDYVPVISSEGHWINPPELQAQLDSLKVRIDSLEAKLSRAHIVLYEDSTYVENWGRKFGAIIDTVVDGDTTYKWEVAPPDSSWQKYQWYKISFEEEK